MAWFQAEPAEQADDWDRVAKTPVWLRVFFSNMLCGCAGFAVVLPSLWPLMRGMGASTTMLGCAVAMYSVGEGLGGKVVGSVYDRLPGHPKEILLSGMTVGCASAVFCGFAPLFGPEIGPLVVVATRFFQGFDNGGRLTIEQSFLGTHVPLSTWRRPRRGWRALRSLASCWVPHSGAPCRPSPSSCRVSAY